MEYHQRNTHPDFSGIHNANILEVVFYGSTFFSCSDDTTIKQVDLETGIVLRVMTDSGPQKRLLLIGNLLYASRYASTVGAVKEWNADTGINTRTFLFPTSITEAVIFGDVLFAAGGVGLFQMNMTTKSITRTFSGHNGGVWRMRSDGRILLSGGGSSDGTIIEWNVTLPSSEPSQFDQTTSLASTTIWSDFTSSVSQTTLQLTMTSASSARLVPPKHTKESESIVMFSSIAASFALIICGACVLLCFRYRTELKRIQRNVAEETSVVVATEMTSILTSTAIVTTHEMSIPAHLEKRFGDDFETDEFVARGGGGDVYKCRATNSEVIQLAEGQPLVVKTFKNSFAVMTETMKNAFHQELTFMWRFRDQPHFARVYAYSYDPACLVMKFYHLGDLSAFIRGHSIAVEQFRYCKIMTFYLLRSLCSALDYVHQNGFAHCDVKPGNVLLEVNEYGWLSPVVSDFGLTRVLDTSQLAVKAYQASELKGASISYAAPEVLFAFRNKFKHEADVVKAGDVFAVAVIILEMMKRDNVWC